MKLLQCHIENFGTLSNFDYTFSQGLNVLEEPNGFGKSTFAAFLKAMLYGFPRTGGRSIANNERKKYLPWQGGVYGGQLDFEFEGVHYRASRTFGRTAAKDTYSLRDMTNRRESRRFSEKLGEELFHLDVDSFMRSIYMPQIMENGPVATTSIQAKLSNLVDNTDDLNNYDSAAERLKTARSFYKKLRGTGGRIDELQEKIDQLDEKLMEAEKKREPLVQVTEEINHLNQEKESQEMKLAQLRRQIQTASMRQSRQVLGDQKAELEKAIETAQNEMEQLDERNPKGYPEKEEVQRQRNCLLNIRQARNSLSKLALDEADRKTVAEEREIFQDEDAVSEEIEACQSDCMEYGKADVKASIQMTREEQERLGQLAALFEQGVPDEEQRKEWERLSSGLMEKRGQLNHLVPSREEEEKLGRLEAFFQGKELELDEIEQCQNGQKDLKRLCAEAEACGLSPEEQREWQKLSQEFLVEVPQEKEIREKQAQWRRVEELEGKKQIQTTVLKPRQPASRAKKTPVWPAAAGAVLVILGLFFFVMSQFVWGAVCVVIGFAAVLGILWLRAGQGGEPQSGSVAVQSSIITEEETRELYGLQKQVNQYLLKFYDQVRSPSDQLVQLLLDRQRYLTLSQKKAEQDGKKKEINGNIQKIRGQVHGLFVRFFPGEEYREDFTDLLKENMQEFRRLKQNEAGRRAQREAIEEGVKRDTQRLKEQLEQYEPGCCAAGVLAALKTLNAQIKEYQDLQGRWENTRDYREQVGREKERLRGRMEGILKKYRAFQPEKTYEECLQELRNRFERYRQAAGRVSRYEKDRETYQNQLDSARNMLEGFLKSYQLDLSDPEGALSQVEEDKRAYDSWSAKLRESQSRQLALRREHPEIFQDDWDRQAAQGELPSAEQLVEHEKGLQNQLKILEDNLQGRRQIRRELQQAVEEISPMEDQRARLVQEKEEAQASCQVLDHAMEFLERAKDNLSNSYVGQVEQGFRTYAKELLGMDFGEALLDNHLEISIDEQGGAREVDCFSTGTIDSIMICMRLALVDALFKEEKPFLILDDPFVNLDDGHTRRALELLHKIARRQQVIYMICNSSRR